MTILDKNQATKGKRQKILQISPEEVGKYALVVGDPARVRRICDHLEDARELGSKREFLTWGGFYKGVQITVTSHGVGCPGAAIVMEELANVGVTHVIRVGSTAALQPGMRIGDIVISTGSMRNDGTTKAHVRDGFPAVPDHFLTHSLIEVALEHRKEEDYKLFVGPGACDDSYYGETPEWIKMLSNIHRLLNVEMEGSVVFTIGYLRGIKTAMIMAVSANLVSSEYVYEGKNQGLIRGWNREIAVALEAIYRYEQGSTLGREIDQADIKWL